MLSLDGRIEEGVAPSGAGADWGVDRRCFCEACCPRGLDGEAGGGTRRGSRAHQDLRLLDLVVGLDVRHAKRRCG